MTPELLREYLDTFRQKPGKPPCRSFRPFRLVLESGTEIVVAALNQIKVSDEFVTVMQGHTWSSFAISAITEIRSRD